MATYSFGSGSLFGFRTDVANPTPVQFGALQSVDVDMSFDIKRLMGQYQFPLAVARGPGAVTWKAATGKIDGLVFNNLFFGTTGQAGQRRTAVNEAGSVPGSSAYTITVANSANFIEDLGVVYATTGLPFTRVASGPTAGQYSVSAGVYTFASGDANAAVLISYDYTVASTGQVITINNQIMGAAPLFKLVLFETFQSKPIQLELNQCTASKLTLPLKNTDFTIASLEGESQADAAGVIGRLSLPE